MKLPASAVWAVAVAAPPLAAFALMASVAAGELVGTAPFAGLVPRNAAEAAAIGNAHDVLRFLTAGENPHAAMPVRPEVISSAVRSATTLEAAMWSRQLELIQLLEARGAITAADRPVLICLAADLGVDDVVEYFAPAGAVGCEEGKAEQAVRARTGKP